jgi:uncharacterized membrane protein
MRNIMLMVHFLGLIMGVGTGIAHMFLGIASSRMEKKEAQKFLLNTHILSKMGTIGITLLVISGGYLITPYLHNIANMPTLIAKLSLVLVLIIFLIIIGITSRKAHQEEPEKYLKRLKSLGQVTLLLSLTIIVLAVITFH